MKRRIFFILMLAGVLASAYSQSAVTGIYRYGDTTATVTFSGQSFRGNWNKDTPISGTFTVSGNRVILNITSGPKRGQNWTWTIVNANTLRDQDGDRWTKGGSGGGGSGSGEFSMSAGGGALFDYSFKNGIEFSESGHSAYMGIRNMSFGGFVFLDATYAELDVSFAYGLIKLVGEGNFPGGSGESINESAGHMLQLGFSLLGKYPMQMDGFTFFPLLGVEYNMVLSWSNESDVSDDAGEMSQLGFLAGVGFDFPLSRAVYIRAEALFNLRLPSKAFNNMADVFGIFGGGTNTTFGMGPRVKVGVGYKF
jgi:hypothetical protein